MKPSRKTLMAALHRAKHWNDMIAPLKDFGIVEPYNTMQSRYSRIETFSNRKHRIEIWLKKTIYQNQTGYKRPKSVSVKGLPRPVTYRELFALAQKNLQEENTSHLTLPTEQNFGKNVTSLIARGTIPNVLEDGCFLSISAVVNAASYPVEDISYVVYAIICHTPNEGSMAYVGIAGGSLRARLRAHLSDSKRRKSGDHFTVVEMIREIADGEIPKNSEIFPVILEQGVRSCIAGERESFFISELKRDGFEVLNVAPPGSKGGRYGDRKYELNGHLVSFAHYVRHYLAKEHPNYSDPEKDKASARIKYHLTTKVLPIDQACRIGAGIDRARRKDRKFFVYHGRCMTLEVLAVEMGKSPESIKSRLRRMGCWEGSRIELESNIFDNAVRPKEHTQDPTYFLDNLTTDCRKMLALGANISALPQPRGRISWKQISEKFRIPSATLRNWARRYQSEPRKFWDMLYQALSQRI